MSSKLDSAQISFLRVIFKLCEEFKSRRRKEWNKKNRMVQTNILNNKTKQNKSQKEKRGDFDWHFLFKMCEQNY